MNPLSVIIIGALIAVLITLVSGVVSMAKGGEFDQEHSTELMFKRVGFQGIAVVLLLVALVIA